MAGTKFSKAILVGLRKKGFTLHKVEKMTGLSQAALKLILEERGSFKSSHLHRIEQATHISTGQLAVASMRKPDKAISELMDAWAEMLEDNPSAKRDKAHA